MAQVGRRLRPVHRKRGFVDVPHRAAEHVRRRLRPRPRGAVEGWCVRVTQRGLYPRSAYDALGYQLEFDQSDPNVFVRRNLPRQFPFVAAGAAVPTTGKLLLSRITLAPGDKITTVNFLTGTTASATQTSGFVGLWSPAG